MFTEDPSSAQDVPLASIVDLKQSDSCQGDLSVAEGRYVEVSPQSVWKWFSLAMMLLWQWLFWPGMATSMAVPPWRTAALPKEPTCCKKLRWENWVLLTESTEEIQALSIRTWRKMGFLAWIGRALIPLLLFCKNALSTVFYPGCWADYR